MDTKLTLHSEKLMVFLNIALALLIVTALWLLSAKLSSSSENEAPASVANALAAVDASTLDSLTEQKLNEQKKLYQRMLAEQTRESSAQIRSVLIERDNEIALLKQHNENINGRLKTLEQRFENSIASSNMAEAPKQALNAPDPSSNTSTQAAASTTSKANQAGNALDNKSKNTTKMADKPATKVVKNPAQTSKARESQTKLSDANTKPLETEDAKSFRWLTVKAGDTLSIIAARVYQDKDAYGKILKANPEVQENPDLIEPGLRLKVPD